MTLSARLPRDFTASSNVATWAGFATTSRHAAVSLWLNAGVSAPQVAEWAGHSVHVLMKVYAKCIDGQQEAAKRRIENALRTEGQEVDDQEGS